MRKLGLFALVLALWAAPRPASAGFFIEGSLGVPWHTNPVLYREPTNILITPGYAFLDLLSVELGLVTHFAQFQQTGGWGLRPMIGLRPPFMPLYGKLVFDFNDLGHEKVSSVGAALGLTFLSFSQIRLFVEGDYLPRKTNGVYLNVIEARLGLSIGI
jgi:hypothetical protein